MDIRGKLHLGPSGQSARFEVEVVGSAPQVIITMKRPTHEEVEKEIRDREVVLHPSKAGLTKSQLASSMSNIQTGLKLFPATKRGPWNEHIPRACRELT